MRTVFFSKAYCKRTRLNCLKLKENRFRLGIKKTHFAMKLVKHRSRLPRGQVEDAPSLETFKVRLDGALSSKVGTR